MPMSEAWAVANVPRRTNGRLLSCYWVILLGDCFKGRIFLIATYCPHLSLWLFRGSPWRMNNNSLACNSAGGLRPAFMVVDIPHGFGFGVQRRDGSLVDAGLTAPSASALAQVCNSYGDAKLEHLLPRLSRV